jgi:hypothetical protein
MTAEKTITGPADADARWLYRVGGASAVALGLGYLITIPLFAHVGAPPTGGEALLRYLAGKRTEWSIIVGLSVVTDLLYVPFAAALYDSLRALNRNLMLLASAAVALFITLDLAVTWTSYASVITLAGDYAAAASDAQRTALVAAANYPASILASRLEPVYSIAILSLGILLIGFVMLKSVFGRSAAYLALATGILGIVSIAGWGFTVIGNALTATIWVLLVGYRLYRLGQR